MLTFIKTPKRWQWIRNLKLVKVKFSLVFPINIKGFNNYFILLLGEAIPQITLAEMLDDLNIESMDSEAQVVDEYGQVLGE